MTKSAIISRVASLLVVALWVSSAAFGKLPDAAGGMMLIALFVGLPLIWFPETIGGITGYMGHGPISLETPPISRRLRRLAVLGGRAGDGCVLVE